MTIYIAGKNLARTRHVVTLLRQEGHTIAYAWYDNLCAEEMWPKVAAEERQAIQTADALVYLWEPDQESARYEAGMAMGLGKPVIISGEHRSFFFCLPNVHRVSTDAEIIGKITAVAPLEAG